jgi:ubiquinone/menaquinone biosynthesis C-methylase UbiE
MSMEPEDDRSWRDHNRQVYDRLASSYLPAFSSDESDYPWLDEFAQSVLTTSQSADPAILDIGSGPAIYALHFRQLGLRSIGMDISHGMLLEGRRQLEDWPAIEADMSWMPIGSNSAISGALVAYSLLHLTERAALHCLRELVRVLSPRAPILILLKEGSGSEYFDSPLRPGQKCLVKYWNAEEASALVLSARITVERILRSFPSSPAEIPHPKLALFGRTAPSGT